MKVVYVATMAIVLMGTLVGCPTNTDPELDNNSDPGYTYDPGEGGNPGDGTTVPGGDDNPGDYIDPGDGDQPAEGVDPEESTPEFEELWLPEGFSPFDIQSSGSCLTVVGHVGVAPARQAAAWKFNPTTLESASLNISSTGADEFLLTASIEGNYTAGTGVWCLCDGEKKVDTDDKIVSHLLQDTCGVGWSSTGKAVYWDGWDKGIELPALVSGQPSAALAVGMRNDRIFRFGVVTAPHVMFPGIWYPGTFGIALDPSTMPPVSEKTWVNCASPDGLRAGGGFCLPGDTTVYAVLWGADACDYGYNCHQITQTDGNRLSGQLRDIVLIADSAFGVGGPDNVMTEIGGPIEIPANGSGEAIVAINEKGLTLAEFLSAHSVQQQIPLRTIRAAVPYNGYLYAVGVTEGGEGVMIQIPLTWCCSTK